MGIEDVLDMRIPGRARVRRRTPSGAGKQD
jgi:hypothetical protein